MSRAPREVPIHVCLQGHLPFSPKAAVTLHRGPLFRGRRIPVEVGMDGITRGRPPPQTVGPEEPEYLRQPHDHNDPKGSDLRCITTVHHDDHKLHDNQHGNSQMTIQPP
ncbi:unnamed protein product [Rangifer tarandus platyrhynchus]|uniref:Uncharacterized protein n=1 Tax=Rangifer tarandus platyrhynchus TaxID=3082113 RepID=A0AC60A9G4_RANTA